MSQPLRFSGIMPANILPFTADLAIDEPAYRRHLRWLADTRGSPASSPWAGWQNRTRNPTSRITPP